MPVMELEISLPAETETKLRAKAAAHRITVETYVTGLLESIAFADDSHQESHGLNPNSNRKESEAR
jgi:hypothetical protein